MKCEATNSPSFTVFDICNAYNYGLALTVAACTVAVCNAAVAVAVATAVAVTTAGVMTTVALAVAVTTAVVAGVARTVAPSVCQVRIFPLSTIV